VRAVIDRAVILTQAGDDLGNVAGLPLVDRLRTTLTRGGIRQVDVVDAANSAEVDAVCKGPSAVALIRANQVFDVDVAKKLAASSVDAPSIARSVTDADAEIWLVPAGGALPRDGAPTVSLGETLWRSVATPAARRAAQKAMFWALRKRVDGPVSRWINRRMSLAVTGTIIDTSITPNQMTIVATLVGIAGVIATFQATWAMVALGAFLVQMQSVLDGCDGEIARLKFKSSRFGEWLDNTLDDQVNSMFGVALGYAVWKLLDTKLYFWLGLGSGIAFTIHNAIFYAQLALVHRSGSPFSFKWWFEKPGQDVTAMVNEQSVAAAIGGFFRSLIRRDVFLFGFFVLCLVRLPQVAVIWYACVAASQFALMMIHVIMGGPWKWRTPR
jgi:phosphatidylglycerophosphate synthase